jgi:L-ascorbate metabolism protein UlaG (beta-lactamase superfamily)
MTESHATIQAGQVEAFLVGGPTLLLRLGGLSFLIDPTFDAPGVYEGGRPLTKLTGPAVAPEDLGPIDAVLLSHDQHPDNLDHAGRALLERVPVVLSTPDAAARIGHVTGLAPWQRTTVGGVTVTALPARHGPEGAEAVAGQVTGFRLTGDGLPTVYVAGDNAGVDVVQQIADRLGPVDIAILFVGAANVGRFGDEPMTLTGERAARAAALLQATLVIPVHADGWAHFTEGVPEVVAAFEAAGLADRLRILTPGVLTAL